MKKLVFLFVAFAAISFASCGNKTANSDATADTTATESVESAAVESDSTAAAADTTAAAADTTAAVAE